jgi:hypothetical protein
MMLLNAFACTSALAAVVQGQFATGQNYTADYSISDVKNGDGMTVERLSIKIKLDDGGPVMTYTYDADAPPVVKASTLGFLLIAVNSGGMEGVASYNYLFPIKGEIRSIGVANRQLHLGKTESIDVERNDTLDSKSVNAVVAKIVGYKPKEFVVRENVYPGSTLLFVANLDYQAIGPRKSLLDLLNDKEVREDPIFYKKLASALDFGAAEPLHQDPGQQVKNVVSDKANLLSAPNASAVTRGYLIKGDEVLVVNRSDDGRYREVIYTSPKHGKVDRWVKCEDINFCDH